MDYRLQNLIVAFGLLILALLNKGILTEAQSKTLLNVAEHGVSWKKKEIERKEI